MAASLFLGLALVRRRRRPAPSCALPNGNVVVVAAREPQARPHVKNAEARIHPPTLQCHRQPRASHDSAASSRKKKTSITISHTAGRGRGARTDRRPSCEQSNFGALTAKPKYSWDITNAAAASTAHFDHLCRRNPIAMAPSKRSRASERSCFASLARSLLRNEHLLLRAMPNYPAYPITKRRVRLHNRRSARVRLRDL